MRKYTSEINEELLKRKKTKTIEESIGDLLEYTV